MRVLMINSFFSVGGPPRVVKGIYDTLITEGHDCILAAGREKPIDGMNVFKIGTPANKYIHLLATRIFDAEGFSSKAATKRLIKKIDKYNPDIIHLHNLHGYYINIDALFEYLKVANKPVVWTLHDCWPFTGHCSYFDFIKCNRWKTSCFSCPQKNEYPKSLFADFSKVNYQRKKEAFTGLKNMTIITPSDWLAELARQSFLGKYPIWTINNGIDLDIFKPTKSDFRKIHSLESKHIILGVAQVWGERKGLDIFVKLANMLDDSYRIVLVGLTDKQLKKLPKTILGIKKTNSVCELAGIYTAADVFANPTREDNFPTVNLESLACGTPVITFNTGGSPETIDETCGIIVDPCVDILPNAIKKALLLSGKTCQIRALRFERNSVYKKYIELYQSISGRRSCV